MKHSDADRVTMRDVAKLAGVAVGTVSRVINHHPKVAESIRKKVEDAIEKTGWRPNAIARSMRTSVTRTIGCILPDIRNPLFSGIAKGAEAQLRAHGYSLILASSDDEPRHEAALLHLMEQRGIDGLLFSPTDEHSPECRALLAGLSIPTLLIEREIEGFDSVVSDQRGGLHRVTSHLIALGHSRIALVTGSRRSRPGRERYQGYMDAMLEAAIPSDPALLRLDRMTDSYAFRQVQDLFNLEQPPTAVIMGGNLMLAGALRAIGLVGKRVPEDLSVVAVGDTDLAELAPPSFTALRWDLAVLGQEAAAGLLALVQSGKGAPRAGASSKLVVPTELVVRRSTAPRSRLPC